jgi:hypothetical protein
MIDTDKINNLHNQAMEETDRAFMARKQGLEAEAKAHFRRAFELEREAAHALETTKIEPSRSIIHRSAATLALDCGEIREAEILAATGLAGNPPEVIAKELRAVLQQVFDALAEKAVGD